MTESVIFDISDACSVKHVFSWTLAENPIRSNVKGWDDNGNFWANETEKRDNETLAETQPRK